MSLRVLGFVCALLLVLSGSALAAEEVDSTGSDTLQVILFRTGALMRGHVIGYTSESEIVFRRTDGATFELPRDDIFSITDEASLEAERARMRASEPSPQGPQAAISAGVAIVSENDESAINPQVCAGFIFSDQHLFLGLGVGSESTDRYSATPVWVELAYCPGHEVGELMFLIQAGSMVDLTFAGGDDYSGLFVEPMAGFRPRILSGAHLEILLGVRVGNVKDSHSTSSRLVDKSIDQTHIVVRLSL